MNSEAFLKSINNPSPPRNVGPLLTAMWFDARGDWDRAHLMAQEDTTQFGSWVHAYLHRKEGDIGNAEYWYEKEGRDFCSLSLDSEWQEIVEVLLAQLRQSNQERP